MLDDIAHARLDVLVLWECSRGDRDLPTWAGLLATCRKQGILIRITTHGRTYDVSNPRDWRTLAEDGVDSAYESEKLSLRTRRGVATAAAAGRPPMGKAPYGYRRTYDQGTGKLAGQEPDPTTAPIAREIIQRVAKSVPVSVITKDLNGRSVPPPAGPIWRRQRVREIALNVAYVAARPSRPGLRGRMGTDIDDDTFYAAARVLNDRSGNGRHDLADRSTY